jgi:hypothetical protein
MLESMFACFLRVRRNQASVRVVVSATGSLRRRSGTVPHRDPTSSNVPSGRRCRQFARPWSSGVQPRRRPTCARFDTIQEVASLVLQREWRIFRFDFRRKEPAPVEPRFGNNKVPYRCGARFSFLAGQLPKGCDLAGRRLDRGGHRWQRGRDVGPKQGAEPPQHRRRPDVGAGGDGRTWHPWGRIDGRGR